MTDNIDTQHLDRFERQLHYIIAVYLLRRDAVDSVLPEASGIEGRSGENMYGSSVSVTGWLHCRDRYDYQTIYNLI